MTETRTYLLTTILAFYGLCLLFIASGRVIGGMSPEIVEQPVRPAPAELMSLEGFTEIRAIGDFSIDVTVGQQFSVEYVPFDEGRGNLRARVDTDILWLEGLGNQQGNKSALVKIAMPEFTAIRANGLPEITLYDLQESDVLIHLHDVYRLNLASSSIDNLMIDGRSVDELYFMDLKTRVRQINISGSARDDHTKIFDQ